MKEYINEIVKSKDLHDMSLEIVEKIIDNETTNEIAKEIPAAKVVVAIKNIFTSISDRIFLKKAMNVIFELKDVNWKERAEFMTELEDKNSSGAEKIMFAIDKMETIEKCKAYGRLCRLRASGGIELDDFLLLTKLVQDAYLKDLSLIKEFNVDEKKEINEDKYTPLASLGLIYLFPSKKIVSSVDSYAETKVKTLEINYLLSKKGRLLQMHYDYIFVND